MEFMRRWRDQRLLRRIRSGDREAANRLVDEHYEAVYRWLLHLCRDAEQAADLTQETYCLVWDGIGGFEGRSSLKTWIHRIAYHAYLQRKRTSRPAGELLPESRDEHSLTEVVLSRSVVADALAQLPEKHRGVVLLHYMQGLTTAEIAAVLDIPTGTVLSRLHNAREKLRDLLAEDELVSEQGVQADVGQK